MVLDSLKTFNNYTSMHTHFSDVVKFLKNRNIFSLTPGKYQINSAGCYGSVSEYLSKDIREGFIEYHKRFIDIQILLKGIEKTGICFKEDCRDLGYDSDNDFGKLEGTFDFITLRQGNFAIFFPHDGHMPQIKYGDEPEEIRKLVIKVPVL